jgi:hypothetical protein
MLQSNNLTVKMHMSCSYAVAELVLKASRAQNRQEEHTAAGKHGIMTHEQPDSKQACMQQASSQLRVSRNRQNSYACSHARRLHGNMHALAMVFKAVRRAKALDHRLDA